MILSDSLVFRFWQYVDVRKKDECWNWLGCLAIRGSYGQINEKGKLLKTHRVSYILQYGKIPKNKIICHKCGNPKCCNPFHLYAGTALDNIADAKRHGTFFVPDGAKGEQHHDAKLNKEKVLFILNSKKKGADLARQFSVTPSAISAVRKGRTWKKYQII